MVLECVTLGLGPHDGFWDRSLRPLKHGRGCIVAHDGYCLCGHGLARAVWLLLEVIADGLWDRYAVIAV